MNRKIRIFTILCTVCFRFLSINIADAMKSVPITDMDVVTLHKKFEMHLKNISGMDNITTSNLQKTDLYKNSFPEYNKYVSYIRIDNDNRDLANVLYAVDDKGQVCLGIVTFPGSNLIGTTIALCESIGLSKEDALKLWDQIKRNETSKGILILSPDRCIIASLSFSSVYSGAYEFAIGLIDAAN